MCYMPEGIVAEYCTICVGTYGNFATGSTQTYVKIQNHPWAMALGGGTCIGF